MSLHGSLTQFAPQPDSTGWFSVIDHGAEERSPLFIVAARNKRGGGSAGIPQRHSPLVGLSLVCDLYGACTEEAQGVAATFFLLRFEVAARAPPLRPVLWLVGAKPLSDRRE